MKHVRRRAQEMIKHHEAGLSEPLLKKEARANNVGGDMSYSAAGTVVTVVLAAASCE